MTKNYSQACLFKYSLPTLYNGDMSATFLVNENSISHLGHLTIYTFPFRAALVALGNIFFITQFSLWAIQFISTPYNSSILICNILNVLTILQFFLQTVPCATESDFTTATSRLRDVTVIP